MDFGFIAMIKYSYLTSSFLLRALYNPVAIFGSLILFPK